MYIRFTTNNNRVVYKGDKKPLVEDREFIDLNGVCAVAECENIPPEYDYLAVTNCNSKTDTWTEKQIVSKEVTKKVPKEIVKMVQKEIEETVYETVIDDITGETKQVANTIVVLKEIPTTETIEEEVVETIDEEIDVEKSRTYLVCDLVAKFRPAPTQEQLAIQNQKRYENLCQQYIRQKYSATDENKVVREYLANFGNEEKKAQFNEYNAYVESCKVRARQELNL